MKLQNVLIGDTMEWKPCLYFDSTDELKGLEEVVSFFLERESGMHLREIAVCYNIMRQIESFYTISSLVR